MQKALYTVRDATRDLLRELGMTTIFGNPGSTELTFYKHWPDDFRYILGLQEASAVAMADGYAQATRNAAFVNLHSAAGVGHAMANIFTAYRNQTPLVITAGQQTRAMHLTEPYLFAKDATLFPKPYVKWSCEPARAQDVPASNRPSLSGQVWIATVPGTMLWNWLNGHAPPSGRAHGLRGLVFQKITRFSRASCLRHVNHWPRNSLAMMWW